MRVSLRRWERFCADAKRSLPEFLAEHYPTLRHPPTAQHWQGWLQRGEVLLLLDGLDEVNEDFKVVLKEELNGYAECPTVITCRTISFEQHRNWFPDFPIFALDELGDELRDQYIRAFPARQPFDTGALIAQLNGAPQLRALAANPLLLSIICYVAEDQRNGTLPATRSELYGKVVDKFMRRRRMEVTYPGGTGDLPLTRKRHILERAALTLFAGLDQQRQLLIDEESLVDALDGAVASEGYPTDPASESPSPMTDALLRDLTRNSGLLPGSEEQGYNFLHLTIQEYLAAAAIARLANTQGWDTKLQLPSKRVTLRHLVDRKAWDPRWQEVIVMLAGQLADPAPLLNLLSDKSRDDLYRHRLAVAAHCLPELNSAIRQSHSELVDRITTAAFVCWCEYTSDNYSGVVIPPHLTGMLPMLVQVNGCVTSDVVTGSRAYQTITGAIKVQLKNRPQGLSILELIGELLRHPREEARLVALRAVAYLGTAAATSEILDDLTQLLRRGPRLLSKFLTYPLRSVLSLIVITLALILFGLLGYTQPFSPRYIGVAFIFLFLVDLLLKVGDKLLAHLSLGYNVFVHWLFGHNARERNNAAEVFGHIGATAATPEILACLADLVRAPREEVSSVAVKAMGALGATITAPEFQARLADLLGDTEDVVGDTVVRSATVAATPEFLAYLFGSCVDGWKVRSVTLNDGEVCSVTWERVGTLGTAAATPMIPDNLADRLCDQTSVVRYGAVETVRSLGAAATTPEILARLADLLRDDDWPVRHKAVEAFRALGAAAATPEILARLADLLRVPGWEKVEPLRIATGLLRLDLGWDVRRSAAMEAVRALGADAATPEILAHLADLLRGPARSEAVETVRSLGAAAATPEILARLADLLHDNDWETRNRAAEATALIMAQSVRIFEMRGWKRLIRSKWQVRSVEELSELGGER